MSKGYPEFDEDKSESYTTLAQHEDHFAATQIWTHPEGVILTVKKMFIDPDSPNGILHPVESVEVFLPQESVDLFVQHLQVPFKGAVEA